MKPLLTLLTALSLSNIVQPLQGQDISLDFGGPPAISSTFLFEPEADLEKGGNLSSWETRLSAPIGRVALSEDWTLGFQLRYQLTSLDWENHGLLDDLTLHQMSVITSLAWRPKDSPWLAILFVAPKLATDFSHVTTDDLFFSAIVGVGYKFSDKFLLLGGAYYSQDFGESRLLPAIGFRWNVTDDFTLSLLPPRLVAAWAFADNWSLSLEAGPTGGRWNVEDNTGRQVNLGRSGGRVGLELQRSFTNGLSFYLGGGYTFGREFEVQDEDDRRLNKQDADDTPYFSTGLRWAF